MCNLLSVLCISILFLLAYPSLSAEGQEVKKIGVKELNDMLVANKGKVIVLDFGATFCPHCRKAVPFMNQMYETYKNQGFELIALFSDQNVEFITTFVQKMEMKYPVFVAELPLLNEYGIMHIPHHVFIDRKGVTRHKETGFSEASKAAFEARVKELLKEGA